MALKDKKIFIPALAYGSARAFAAALRAVGLEAEITPPSDDRTLELGARYTSGDECFPAKVTMGDFFKLLERPDVDPSRTVFFMASADGPCRFGQYSSHLRRVLDAHGYEQTALLTASCDNSYRGLGALAGPFVRTAWRAVVAADILQKLLLSRRPHEQTKGSTDRAYEECLDELCWTVEGTPTAQMVQLRALRDCLVRCRERFRAVPVRREAFPVRVGIVGEIFCRLNTFSNQELVRRLEEYGAEAWISDFTEWIWYTNAEELRLLRLRGRLLSFQALAARIRHRLQRQDEHFLLEPFREDFAGYEEPAMQELLDCARPYLPPDGAMGEMVLNVGKAVYLAQKGVDGIIDISPFTCMNGIICEALYPRISKDYGGIPIRNFYFDGTQSDLDLDLGVFLELARTYQRRRLSVRPKSAANALAELRQDRLSAV